MLNAFKTLAVANARHAIEHPIRHGSIMTVYAVGASIVVCTTARALGERKLRTMKSNFETQWD